MAADDDSDPREGPLHPRHRTWLAGHGAAERQLLAAWHAGRFHHAWLIGGPRGIGKATLAYRFARFVLAHREPGRAPHDSLDVDPAAQAAQLVASRGHPDLLVVEREFDKGRLKASTGAEAARRTGHFLGLTAADGGWRVVIVDAADDLNPTSANALLKVLEEPPARAVFLIVAHAPGRLLPTIRSRCVSLTLEPLIAPDMDRVLAELAPQVEGDLAAAAALSGGSPGRAVEIAASGAAQLFADFLAMAAAASFDRARMLAVAGRLQGRAGQDQFAAFSALLEGWVMGEARAAALAGEAGRAAALARAWAEIGHSIAETNTLNLDRRQTVLSAFESLEQARRA